MFRTILGIVIFSVAGTAASINFSTTSGTTNATGQMVSASGTIATNANGTVTVTLTDTLANPTDAGQLLSDLFFNLSLAPTTALNTTTTPTTSGNLINIA